MMPEALKLATVFIVAKTAPSNIISVRVGSPLESRRSTLWGVCSLSLWAIMMLSYRLSKAIMLVGVLSALAASRMIVSCPMPGVTTSLAPAISVSSPSPPLR